MPSRSRPSRFAPPDPRPSRAHPQHRAERKKLEKEHPAFGWTEGLILGLSAVTIFMNIEKDVEKKEKRHDSREKGSQGRDGDRGRGRGKDREGKRERERKSRSEGGSRNPDVRDREREGRRERDRERSRDGGDRNGDEEDPYLLDMRRAEDGELAGGRYRRWDGSRSRSRSRSRRRQSAQYSRQ